MWCLKKFFAVNVVAGLYMPSSQRKTQSMQDVKMVMSKSSILRPEHFYVLSSWKRYACHLIALSYLILILRSLQGIDILSLSMLKCDIFVCSANGKIRVSFFMRWCALLILKHVQRFSPSFERTAVWSGHNGIVLSSIVTCDGKSKLSGAEIPVKLVTGGNDDNINVRHFIFRCMFIKRPKVWDILPAKETPTTPHLVAPMAGLDDISDDDSSAYTAGMSYD